MVVDNKSMVENDVMTCKALVLSMMEYELHYFYFAAKKTNWGKFNEYFLHTAAV